ncbi:MAG: RDD family protein [Myxococcota bacterium]
MLATLPQRLWSAAFDGLFYVGWFAFVAFVQPWPDALHGALKALIWFTPPLLVEPLCVWLVGGTAGQRLVGLRVRSTDENALSLLRLVARHFSKAALLGVSVFYLPFSKGKQALHDAIFGTYVVAEPVAADFAFPPPEPIHWGPFFGALPAAWVASVLAAIPLLLLLGLVTAFTTSAMLEDVLDFATSVVMSLVFMVTMIRRGRKSLAETAASS